MQSTPQNLSPEMHSLETKIRDLMIAIAMEQDQIHLQRDTTDQHAELYKLGERRERLSHLASLCILNIDKEIEFFSK